MIAEWVEVRDWSQVEVAILASLLPCSIEADEDSSHHKPLVIWLLNRPMGTHVCLAPLRPVPLNFTPAEGGVHEFAVSIIISLPSFLQSQIPTLSAPLSLSTYFVSFLQNHRLLAGLVKACHSLSEASQPRNSRVTIPQPRPREPSQCLLLFCDDPQSFILASRNHINIWHF